MTLVTNSKPTSQENAQKGISFMVITQAKEILNKDFGDNFPETVHELVKKLYSKRNENGEPIETLSQTFRRVSLGVAVARIKYVLRSQEIIRLTLEKVLDNDHVIVAAAKYYEAMGERKFFANTPCNINANPDISLYVLQYEAHGEILGWNTHKIWLMENDLRKRYERLPKEEKEKVKKWVSEIKGDSNQKTFYPNVVEKNKHEYVMGYYATKIRRKGALAACGVTNAGDSIEEIEKAAQEIMDATKASMGMGINTSSIRPWQTPNSDGSTASGPDRFVEKLFCPAGQSIAQGGRRGGAFIELRDSNHPDITLFLSKKRLPSEPSFPMIYEKLDLNTPTIDKDEYENELQYKNALKERELKILQEAFEEFSRASYEYYSKQEYLKNYNISVRAVSGFMKNVEMKEWYPAYFQEKPWKGVIYDFTNPALDENGKQKVNPLNKELVFKTYSVNLEEFPTALEDAEKQGLYVIKSEDGKSIQVKKDGASCFYAPDIFKRIALGMVNDGEPGIQFGDLVEAGNANNHVYELNTCNPCGEQNLPAQIGFDGIEYRGTCNLSTIHAAHKTFWSEDGGYIFEKMEDVAELVTEFMDDVTTVSHFPIPTQNSTSRRERRNGGGFAGVAEFIARHEFEFASEESNMFVKELYDRFAKACVRASRRLAEERGTYEIWQGSTYQKKGLKVRNSCMINQQPTGTMAQLCGTSWGPEPFNGIVFSRKVRDSWVKFTAPGFEEIMKKKNAWPTTLEEQKELLEKIYNNGKKVTGLNEIPEEVQSIFKINTEIDPINYMNHLAAIQSGVGGNPECFNALSNTCAIKSGMSYQYAQDVVLMSYKQGVKSITFYPDGTRLSQPVEEQEKKEIELNKLIQFLPYQKQELLSTNIKKENITEEKVNSSSETSEMLKSEQHSEVRIRPKRLFGFNEEVMTPEGNIHVHVYFDDKGPRQVFAHLTRSGGVISGMIEAICRMATKALKWGCPAEDVASGLLNIQGGPKIIGVESASIPDAIGKVLLEASKGQYQIKLFRSDEEEKETQLSLSDIPVQTEFHTKHEILFDENINPLEEQIKQRISWIAQGHITQCPCCHAEFIPESFGNPACKNGPVCLNCGWSHCG